MSVLVGLAWTGFVRKLRLYTLAQQADNKCCPNKIRGHYWPYVYMLHILHILLCGDRFNGRHILRPDFQDLFKFFDFD